MPSAYDIAMFHLVEGTSCFLPVPLCSGSPFPQPHDGVEFSWRPALSPRASCLLNYLAYRAN